MMDCSLVTTVPDWIIDHLETLDLSQKLVFDYSRGGKSLEFTYLESELDKQFGLSKRHKDIMQ